MTMLQNITCGLPIKQDGQRVVISGVEKVGKTTLACDAPNSLLIPLETGYGSIKTPRLGSIISDYRQVEELCLELIKNAQAGKIARGSSIVWDSGTALERLIHSEVLRLDVVGQKKLGKSHNMETACEGYGKAYAVANKLFAEWLDYQTQLAIFGGINIIVTCHVFAAKVIDPAHGEYDTWDLLLHSPKNARTYGKREMITQWADLVGFMHEPMFVMKANAKEGEKLSRGISSDQGRALAVDRAPMWVAGNRHNMHGVIPIPAEHGWNALAHEIFTASGIDVFNRDVVPTKEGA